MASSAQPRWFVSRNEKRFGPFSADQLMQFVSARKLLPDDSVSQQTNSGWVAAKSLDWLFPTVAEHAEAEPVARSTVSSDSGDALDLGGATKEPQGPLSMKGIRIQSGFTLTFGDFQLLRKVGAGGMGAVYLAHQRSKSRRVALKMLAADLAKRPAFVKRFNREAMLLGTLDHGNIVQGFGVGEEAGIPFLAMEYVDGLSAAQLVQKLGKLDVGDAVHLILRCAEGLAYGHSRDVIHRDVAPGNILISCTRIVKLADFGLAKPTKDEVSSVTESSITLGTPKYMAPEQTLNAKYADWRSDIYSLAIVLYQFVTGELPFHGDTAMELLKAKDQGQFTSARRLNDNVPPRLDLIIDRMLARDPRNRPQKCADLIREIESLGVHSARLSFDPSKLRTRSADNSGTTEREKLEILMVQAELTEVRVAQEILKQKRTPAHVFVAGTTLNAVNYVRREGTYASAPRPHLIILGRNVTPAGSLAILNEIKAQLLTRVPVAVLTDSPEEVWDYFQGNGLPDNLFVFDYEDRQLLGDLLESAQDVCVTQVE